MTTDSTSISREEFDTTSISTVEVGTRIQVNELKSMPSKSSDVDILLRI